MGTPYKLEKYIMWLEVQLNQTLKPSGGSITAAPAKQLTAAFVHICLYAVLAMGAAVLTRRFKNYKDFVQCVIQACF